MYHASGRLPHLLTPEAYHTAASAAREARTVFHGVWHLVATRDDLPRPGDYVTRQVLGRALLVRNIAGEIRIFANVCAHRHCLLKGDAKGHSRDLVCPYHGWGYDAKGRSRQVRGVEHFQAPGGEWPSLARYRTALCGRLVFVALDDDAPALKTFLGEFHDLLADRFGDDARPILSMDPDYPCNWKVFIENSLEGYHAPNVHPDTFRGDPDELTSEHRLLETRTEFLSQMDFQRDHHLAAWLYQSAEARLLQSAGEPAPRRYRHVHIFPNLTFSFSDSTSVIQGVQPTSATRSYGVVRQYSLMRRRWPWLTRVMLGLWGRLTARVSRRIILEDFGVYDLVQRGLEVSPLPGLLGRPEERIHRFHQWMLKTLDAEPVSPRPEG